GVLLRTRQGELFFDDLLGEHEPRVLVSALHDVLERAQGVEPGEVGGRQALAGGVQPQRGRPGQDTDAVFVSDLVPVLDALGVVPHAVAVDDVATTFFGDAEHAPVHVRGHTREHVLRRRAQTLGPVLPDQVVVATDPTGSDDHCLRAELELTDRVAATGQTTLDVAGGQDRAAYTLHRAGGDHEFVDPVPKTQIDRAAFGRRTHPTLERLDQTRAGTPGDVEARHGVAVPVGQVTAAFGPADHGKDLQPHVPQPGVLLPGGEVHVGLGPLAWPGVLGPVEI